LTEFSYNASFFQVVTANDYNIDFVDRASPDWNTMNMEILKKNLNPSNLTINDIKTTYSQRYVSAHGDVVLWVEKVSIQYAFTTFHNHEKQNFTLSAIKIPLDTPIQPSEARIWAQIIDESGWAAASDLRSNGIRLSKTLQLFSCASVGRLPDLQ
jgi:hypothetical protein